MRKMSIMVAVDANMGIGLKNSLPWRLKKETQHFKSRIRVVKDETKRNAVVLGRRNWESIPPKLRPLKGLVNVVVTRQQDYVAEGEDVHVVHSLEQALELVSTPPLDDQLETVWNIGGSDIYKEALDKNYTDRIFISKIHKAYEVDTFFPKWDECDFTEISDEHSPAGVQEEEEGVEWTCHVYQAK